MQKLKKASNDCSDLELGKWVNMIQEITLNEVFNRQLMEN